MPLLTRMVLAPLFIDVRRGAVQGLAELLADRRISSSGRVAVVVGRGQGATIVDRLGPLLDNCEVFTAEAGSVGAATDLVAQLRKANYDAVVGIGGGRTLDVTKWAASRLGLPMVAVATNLAHDGIASPVSSLDNEGGKGSYGVSPPIAVVIDLDFVRDSPPRMVRSGIGDVVSNLSAIADWELAHEQLGEPVDGLAVTLARTAAEALLHRTDGVGDDEFLIALAEGLVLSGMAMVAAGTSLPCSGGDHEILHAVDALFPGTGNHGELAGIGAMFCFFLRDDTHRLGQVDACLQRHGLPRLPADVGLTEEQFVRAVRHAPGTRPGRFTILEHLDLSEAQVTEKVRGYVDAFGR
ncbi:MAG: iron-containing alcohol dehydrogenase family protein [Actinomycetes bacterium]